MTAATADLTDAAPASTEADELVDTSTSFTPAQVEQPPNVVRFPSRRGRPQKSSTEPRVSVEQVSKGTHVVRIRWIREDGVKDGVVVNRLKNNVVKEIKRTIKRYEQFKEATLASWKSRTVREGNETGTDPQRNV